MGRQSIGRQPAPPYPTRVPLLKGALVALDAGSQSSQTVPFQYNPATLKRTLKPNQVGSTDSDRSTAARFTGAATEMITLEARMESIDSQVSDPQGGNLGIYPLLAALELFAFPTTQNVSKYQSDMDSGSIDIVPPLAPRLIFVWGPHRVLPVRLESIEITEQMYDAALNPISAVAELTLRVLTYSDVSPQNDDYNLFFSHQQHMERMAAYVPPSQANRVTGVTVSNPQES